MKYFKEPKERVYCQHRHLCIDTLPPQLTPLLLTRHDGAEPQLTPLLLTRHDGAESRGLEGQAQ